MNSMINLTPSPPTLVPATKYYPQLKATVRMAPKGSAHEGWLDLGDLVVLAYGPSDDYAGAANPKDAASTLINKVRSKVGDFERCAKIRWEGDASHYRRLVPNADAKTFIAMRVRTPTAQVLAMEMGITTFQPELKHYPQLKTTARMAPKGSAYEGWLDLGDLVALAYGPSDGYAGAANPKNAACQLISKVKRGYVRWTEPPKFGTMSRLETSSSTRSF